MIKSIEIKGFKNSSIDAKVTFCRERVSIVYGENGCGKTTLLKVIHTFLDQNEKILREENVESLKVKYINKEKKIKTIKVFKEEVIYNWDQYIESELTEYKSILMGVDRGVSTITKIEPQLIQEFIQMNNRREEFMQISSPRKLREFSEELSIFLSNSNNSIIRRTRMRRSSLSTEANHAYLSKINMDNIDDLLVEKYNRIRSITTRRVQNALFETLSMTIDNHNTSVDKLPSNIMLQIEENKDRLIEALEYDSVNQFQNKLISNLNNFDKTLSIEGSNNTILHLYNNMIKELSHEKELLSSFNTLIEEYSDFLDDGKKLEIENNRIRVKCEGSYHTISELSSGERHLLTLLTIIMLEGRERNLVMIDEPEISLNTIWQSKFVNICQKLAPGTQFILASHSPSIAKGYSDNLCKLERIIRRDA